MILNWCFFVCFVCKAQLIWSHTPRFSHARLDVVAGETGWLSYSMSEKTVSVRGAEGGSGVT